MFCSLINKTCKTDKTFFFVLSVLGVLFITTTDRALSLQRLRKKTGFFLLSKVRFPTFVVRRRNRPAGEGNSGFSRDKPIIRISPPSHVASSDRMITASSLFRV